MIISYNNIDNNFITRLNGEKVKSVKNGIGNDGKSEGWKFITMTVSPCKLGLVQKMTAA